MRSNDLTMTNTEAKQKARELMVQALKDNDADAYSKAFDQMMEAVADGVRAEYDEKIARLESDRDAQVLAARHVRQLTGEERNYYQKLTWLCPRP